MATGVIKRLNAEKGYGFIQPDGDTAQADVFFHATGVTDPRFAELAEQNRVEFEITTNAKGPRAEKVRRIA